MWQGENEHGRENPGIGGWFLSVFEEDAGGGVLSSPPLLPGPHENCISAVCLLAYLLILSAPVWSEIRRAEDLSVEARPHHTSKKSLCDIAALCSVTAFQIALEILRGFSLDPGHWESAHLKVGIARLALVALTFPVFCFRTQKSKFQTSNCKYMRWIHSKSCKKKLPQLCIFSMSISRAVLIATGPSGLGN